MIDQFLRGSFPWVRMAYLVETMVEYAKSPEESRSAIRERLLKLASEMP